MRMELVSNSRIGMEHVRAIRNELEWRGPTQHLFKSGTGLAISKVHHLSTPCPRQSTAVIVTAMSAFKVDIVARNPKNEELATPPLSVVVDSASLLTWLPADLLRRIGVTPRRKRVFATATQQRIEREIGYAILSAEGYETNDEVVFAEAGDMTLLGVRTLEGFGVMVDNIAHRFVATTTIVAWS